MKNGSWMAQEFETVEEWKKLFSQLVPESVLKDYMQNPEKAEFGRVGGYQIIGRFEYEKTNGTISCVVLGKNENAPSPYATWTHDYNGGYSMGHYFATLEAAKKDMADRVSASLEVNMREEYRKENALADIEMVLKDAFSEKQVEALLKNDSFLVNATFQYQLMDHSDENEALQAKMEGLYKEMVKEHIIFDFDVLESIQGKKIYIGLLNDKSVSGIAYVNLQGHLDEFFVEGKTEQGKDFTDFVKIGDVKSLSVDGKEIYPRSEENKLLTELRENIKSTLQQVNELYTQLPSFFQKDLLQYARCDIEMLDKARQFIDENDVLYPEDKSDILKVLYSKDNINRAYALYYELDTMPREHCMEALKKAFCEMYPLDVEKKKGIDELIEGAAKDVNDSKGSSHQPEKEYGRE